MFILKPSPNISQDSSVTIVIICLDSRRVLFPFPTRTVFFHHGAHTGSGAHTAIYRMDIGGSFPAGKAAGASS